MRFIDVYNILHNHYGPQRWWPGDTPVEIIIGAVLTQNTAWTNVEKAITRLKQADALDADTIVAVPHQTLAEWIRPAGYFNIKANRLRNLCLWYLEQGGYDELLKWNTAELRGGLLSVNGVGHETADDVLLYAFQRPVFVIDAYTRRIFSRLGLAEHAAHYESLRQLFEQRLQKETITTNKNKTSLKTDGLVELFNEYHALIVNHGKDVCRKRPLCAQCCLNKKCPGKAEFC